MKGSWINECVIYTALWCLYYLQGILYAGGGIISQGILLIILILSIYYTGLSLSKYKLPSFLKVVAVFLGLFVVYFLASYLDSTPIYVDFTMEQQVTAFGALKNVLISLLPIYSYYYFSRNGMLTERNMSQYILCLLVLTTIIFIRRQSLNLAAAISMGSDQEEFTNNVAYDFVGLMPLLVFLHKKPTLQFVALIYIMVFILLGMKRGAILVGIICVLYFLYQSYRSANRKMRKRIVALTVVALVGFAYFAIDFMASSDYFQYRLETTMEGNSSGRDFIYSTLYEHILSRDSIGTIIFGEGINHTVVIAGKYAHNDWLELGINMGLLGVLVYIIYFLTLGINTFNARKHDQTIFASLLLCCVVMFSTTLFSMSYNSLSIGITMALGYSLAHRYNNHL